MRANRNKVKDTPAVGEGYKQFIPLKPTVRVRRSFIHQPKILKKLLLVIGVVIVLSLLIILFSSAVEQYNLRKNQKMTTR